MRDHLLVFINGQRHEVRGSDCFLTLSDFLRLRLALIGTKIVCSEGDCGACTVLVGRPAGDTVEYRPIDSCIRFMFQLDGTHIVTVEGLRRGGELSPVQQAMVECHGSQCGFCTPGFVMAMTGHCHEHARGASSDEDWKQALTGNLCRCTGYTSILAAGRVAQEDRTSLDELYPEIELPSTDESLDLRANCDGVERRVFCPATLAEALEFRAAHPQAKVIAGATDVGVQWNKGQRGATTVLDLNRVAALEGARIEAGAVVAGARATWTELLEVFRAEVPEFAAIIEVFGAPQIRHVGTLGGNIVNASPIADSIPFLYVMEAELELASPAGTRRVNINNFYKGYKQLDLHADELLTSVRIPLPAPGELLRLFKVSRRRDLDISTFTAAIRIKLDGEQIADAALAYGAVGPTVLRLRATEQFLRGKTFGEATMQAAGDVALGEITPITDVRGRADYRRQLARNVLMKFYLEQQLATL